MDCYPTQMTVYGDLWKPANPHLKRVTSVLESYHTGTFSTFQLAYAGSMWVKEAEGQGRLQDLFLLIGSLAVRHPLPHQKQST